MHCIDQWACAAIRTNLALFPLSHFFSRPSSITLLQRYLTQGPGKVDTREDFRLAYPREAFIYPRQMDCILHGYVIQWPEVTAEA